MIICKNFLKALRVLTDGAMHCIIQGYVTLRNVSVAIISSSHPTEDAEYPVIFMCHNEPVLHNIRPTKHRVEMDSKPQLVAYP